MDALDLARTLLRCPSITPAEAGTLTALAAILEPMGFVCRRYPFGPVDNLYARWGKGQPHFAFAGHVDVVPPGDLAAWTHDPFAGEVAGDTLYGRGAVDMKGAIAAFVAALPGFLAAPPARGSLSLLLTCDEEGPAVGGTAPLLEHLTGQGEKFDACLVGEPTSDIRIGDTIKHGRRGSLTGTLTVTGRQGHVAYPERADNPVPRLLRLLTALTSLNIDSGTPDFPASHLEVVSVDVGNPTANLIPSTARALFNVRFNVLHTADTLAQKLRSALETTGEPFRLDLLPGSEPFLTAPGPLTRTVAGAVRAVMGQEPRLSTTGGTSDARFISRYCPVVELGLSHHTAHQADERVTLAELASLQDIYRRVLEDWFAVHAR